MEKTKKMARKTCCFAKTFFKKTQELIEISQINLKIMQMKNKLERKLVKFGYFVYKKQDEDGIANLKDFLEDEKFKVCCEDIDKIYEEIDNLEEELSEIKKDSICVMEYERKLEKKECMCKNHGGHGEKENKEKEHSNENESNFTRY